MAGPDSLQRPSRAVGAAANWLAFVAAIAVAFALTPYLIRTLGPARYDVWCVVEAILAYFTLLDFGIAPVLVRQIARHRTAGDVDERNRIVSSCGALYSVAGVLALVIGVPLVLLLAPGLGAKTGDATDVLVFMLIMLVNLAISLPLSLFPSLLDGLERFAWKSLVRVGMLAVKTTAIVLVTQQSDSLWPLAIVSLAVNLLEIAIMTGGCYRFLPGLRITSATVNRETIRLVSGSSIHAFLAMVAGRITLQTGAIVIGIFLPAGQVTLFATASRLIDYAKTLLRTITTTLTPGIAALDAAGDREGIRRLIGTATTGVLLIAIPVNTGLYFFGHPFLSRWLSAELAEGAMPVLQILAVTLSLGVAQSVAARVLYGLGQLRGFARLALAEAGVNLVLTVLLIGPLGIFGVAVAVMVPNLLFCVLTIVLMGRATDLTATRYWSAWRMPILTNAIPVAIWSALGSPEAAWLPIVSYGIAGLIPYGFVIAMLNYRSGKAVPAPDRADRTISQRRVVRPAIPTQY